MYECLWLEKYGRRLNRVRSFLATAKISLKIKRSERTKKSEIKKEEIGEENKKEVKA
jgi:hypothetical protein